MNDNEKITGVSSKSKSYKRNTINDLIGSSKLPPQALEMEEAVLGAIMLEQNALTAIIDIIKPETFYKDAHQKIFTAVQSLFARSEPVDILTVTNELKKSSDLELVGGAFYISQLTNRIASSANVEYHARIIIQKYIQRELIRIASEITHDSYEDSTDVLELLDKAEKNLFAIGEDNLRRNWSDIRGLIGEAIKQIEEASKVAGHLIGVPSGFTELDRVTSGWQKSDLIIIAARPSMGKTALVLNMARNIAVDFKKPIAFFSLEMSSVQLATRLISSETLLKASKLKDGSLENYEWQQLHSKIIKLTDAPLYIDDTPAITIFELRAKCRRLKQQHKIEAVIIDYLQLMAPGVDLRGNREQEISNISRSLKSLAKELNIPIIVLSQLSRAVETRGGNKKPILSDLRESGAIEQDADIVLFIYRPEYYQLHEDEDGSSTEGIAQIIIAKHRNGATGTVKLRFIKEYARFDELNDYNNSSDDNNKMNRNYEFDNNNQSNSYIVPSKLNKMEDNKDKF